MFKFLPFLFVGGCVAGATTGIVCSTTLESEDEIKKIQFDVKLASTAGCVPVNLGHTEAHKFGKVYMCSNSPEKGSDGLIPLYYLEEGVIEKFNSSTEKPLSLMKRIHSFKQENATGDSATYYLSFNLVGSGGDRKIPAYNSPSYNTWSLFSGFNG